MWCDCMKYVYGILLFIWTVVEAIQSSRTDFKGTGVILIALCLFIVKEKFLDKPVFSFIYAVFIAAMSIISGNGNLLPLLGIVLVDMAYFKRYGIMVPIALASVFLCMRISNAYYVFLTCTGMAWGYALGESSSKEKKYLELLDSERGARYQLEKTQVELVRLQNEVERSTEIRERNRIAREIHDNIGHSIAGVLFQLRAAEKLVSTNSQKVEQILHLCNEKLAEALETARNTVYNIKSDQLSGIDCIDNIVKEFKFCKVNFNHSGDFSILSATHLNILEATTKELLTNALKYSKASEIKLKIDINSKYIRLFYSDNGKGCEQIKENVGLSGIRERMRNLGGTYSVDGKNGFTLVCTLPNKSEVENDESSIGR